MEIVFERGICAHVMSTPSGCLKRNLGSLRTPKWKVRYLAPPPCVPSPVPVEHMQPCCPGQAAQKWIHWQKWSVLDGLHFLTPERSQNQLTMDCSEGKGGPRLGERRAAGLPTGWVLLILIVKLARDTHAAPMNKGTVGVLTTLMHHLGWL